MMGERLFYFDQMKGIAILLVVIGHVVQFSYGYNISDVVNMLGVFHMPVFFYISGFLAYKGTKMGWVPVGTRIFQKVSQLLIPLIVVGSTFCIFQEHDLYKWATTGFGGYWFLYVLAIFTMFFICYEQFASKISKWYFYVGLWLLPYILLIFLKIYHKTSAYSDYIPVNNIVTYYRYYLIGWLCHKYAPLNRILFENRVVYALGFVAYFLQWYFCELHNMFLIFLGGVGAIIVLQNWSNSKNAESQYMRILSFLGRNSLSIYVFHYFFIPDVSNVMHGFLQVENPFIWMLTFSVLLSAPIIAASCFVGSLVENNKLLKFIILGKSK